MTNPITTCTTSHSRDIPLISIHLPEDDNCPRPDSRGFCCCVVRTGGDLLEGEILLRASLDARLAVDVCFEGFCRTWIGNAYDNSRPCIREVRFLQQVDSIKSKPSERDVVALITELRTLTFKFRIPERIPMVASNVNSDPRLSQLCPSMSAGAPHEQDGTGSLFMQPIIFYRLSVSVSTKGQEPQLPRRCVARGITIMPTTTARPPTYTNAFEKEFRLQGKTRVRNHFYGRSKGILELFAEEPQPLNILDPGPRPSTIVSLKISFSPRASVAGRASQPYNWPFLVRTRLRRRVFYATELLDKEPTLRDVGKKSIGMSEQYIQSEERRYSHLSWRVDHISSNGKIVAGGDKPLPWTATIPVVITAQRALTPSFLTSTAALRFSIVFQVSIAGLWISHARLEIPVQVIRDPSVVLGALVDSLEHGEDHGGDLDELSSGLPPKYRRVAF